VCAQPEPLLPRRFLITWRDGGAPPTVHDVGCLTATPSEFTFRYLPGAHAAHADRTFRPLPGLPDLDRLYQATQLFLFFSDRLMDPRRPEFPAYVRALDLPPEPSELDLLSRSQGVTKGDHVTVIEEPHVAADGSTSHLFIVRGVRFAAPNTRDAGDAGGGVKGLGGAEQLVPGDELHVQADPDNPVNPHALHLLSPDGAVIGWVPDALVSYVRAVTDHPNSRITVHHRNDMSMPPHLRLIAHLQGTLPEGQSALPQLDQLQDRATS
jgi:hypothetical protein